MKRLFLGLVIALSFVGCFEPSTEKVVARINDEVIYNRDIDYVKLNGENIDDLFRNKAWTSHILKEMPQLAARWERYSQLMDSRILTIVYQRYHAMECLLIPEKELKVYFNKHKSEFVKDSLPSDFLIYRAAVAQKLFLEKNADSLNAFIKSKTSGTVAGDELRILENEFIENFKRNLVETTLNTFYEKHGVVRTEISDKDLEKYFHENPKKFMTLPGLELYHIQMYDSSKLAKLNAQNVKSLDEFKTLASKNSQNTYTAPNGGYIGKVKERNVLPYQIGFISEIFNEFRGKELGTISKIYRSPSENAFHVFYLASVVPAEQKSLERAKGSLRSVVEKEGDFKYDPSFVHITKNGKPLITEQDILDIYKENPTLEQNNRSRENFLQRLAETAIYSAEALQLGLDKTWEYKALKDVFRFEFLNSAYNYEKDKSFTLPEDSLKKVFEKVGNPLRGKTSFEDARGDLEIYLKFPKNIVQYVFYANYTQYRDKKLEDVEREIIARSVGKYLNDRDIRAKREVWANAKIEILDTAVKHNLIIETKDMLFKLADSLTASKNLRRAEALWRSLRDEYPEDDSLFAEVTLKLAQFYSDIQNYENAEREYNAFLNMWPSHQSVEKALFSRGFILAENLKRNEEALKLLQEFQEKFPQSELKESVDWMVENIKSGGKLAEDLMKKINEDEEK